MDSEVVDSHVQKQQEDEDNHGNKSVLRRVKAKAIKIKDTIKKHGHGHNLDQHIHVDSDLDKEDEQDEVEGTVQDPEVYGAPIYESAAVRSAIVGQEPDQETKNVVVSSSADDQTEAVKSFDGAEKVGERKVNMEEESHAPADSKAEAYTPPNYQSKVTGLAGACTEEICVTSIQDTFTGMNIQDEPSGNTNTELKVLPTADGIRSYFAEGVEQEGLPTANETKRHSTGSHDQFLPQQSATIETQYICAGSRDESSPEPKVPENPAETTETNNVPDTISEEQLNYKPMKDLSDHGCHTENISSTSASDENQIFLEEEKSENTTSMPRTGEDTTKQEKCVSMKDYLAEKLRPGEEEKALAEVISEVFNNKKEKPTKVSGDEDSGMAEVVSDAIHGPKEGLKKPEDGIEKSNVNSPGKGGVVDKLKGMVGYWFGKAAENQSSQGGEGFSDNSAPEVETGQSGQAAVGKRHPDLST